MHCVYEIKDGAIFVSDAHESFVRTKFSLFIKKLLISPPPQLFLMGDMFDVLVGGVRKSVKMHKEVIQDINELSKKTEIFYFEGNHDYDLKKIFNLVNVFTISEQPVCFIAKNDRVYLSHGDVFGKFSYKVYTNLMRSKITIWILDKLNNILDNYILNRLLKNMENKDISRKINNFENIARQNVLNHKIEKGFIAQGHYHQNTSFCFGEVSYYNFSSFGVDCGYDVAHFNNYSLEFEHKIFIS